MTSISSTANRDQIEHINDLVKDIHTAMLVTAAADGTLRSRPMAAQQMDDQGNLWFFTDATSGKVDEIKDDHHVNVAFAEPGDNKYLSISGRANVVRDRAKIDELWNSEVSPWFPNGKDDPGVVLIKVRVQLAEYWDAPGGAMVQLYAYAKSAITGQRPSDVAQHASVRM
jgi:general stress protein 26